MGKIVLLQRMSADTAEREAHPMWLLTFRAEHPGGTGRSAFFGNQDRSFQYHEQVASTLSVLGLGTQNFEGSARDRTGSQSSFLLGATPGGRPELITIGCGGCKEETLSGYSRMARNLPLETPPQPFLLDLKVVMRLEVQPESCRGAQVLGQS